MVQIFTLEMNKINKSFKGFSVLKNVNLMFSGGQCYGLVGANGAGKSTLMNILGGQILPDSGEIFINGEKVILASPRQAKRMGIGFVHQQPQSFEALTVAESIILDHMPRKWGVFFNRSKAVTLVQNMLSKCKINIDPLKTTSQLSLGDKHLVCIARVLLADPQIIIFDEPTDIEQGLSGIYRIQRLDSFSKERKYFKSDLS